MEDKTLASVVVAMVIGVFFLMMAAEKGCSDGDTASAVLRHAGYTGINTTGFEYGSCGRDDQQCTGFTATSPSGANVRGAVGCGWYFKGCTIRIEP
jgi:hypothetical protein